MAFVKIDHPDNFEKSLKAWKRQCLREGILEEVRKREAFVSKAVIKRNKLKSLKRKLKLNRLKIKKYY